MRPLRRTEHEARIEIMPLIDVVFLLLTFFIYAMVLMVRAEVLPVPLESYVSGTPAEPRPTISVTLAIDGNIYVGTSIVMLNDRSEEHTSELQSRRNLVCRLLLEKKKKQKIQYN